MIARTIRRAAPAAGLALALAVFASGCAKPASEDASMTADTTAQVAVTPAIEKAREAGTMALAIEQEPDRTAAILAEHGMTQAEFEDLLYTIAQDPALTEEYEAARGGSS